MTEGGLTWSFNWNLGNAGSGGNPDPAGSAVDGTYIVSAEAFDMYDIAGPSKSLTVTLNRSAPDKVEGLAGGRNGSVVDLEWSEVGERDIIGYQVFRKVGGTEVPIPSCPMSTSTSCTDTTPPPASGGNVDYVAYAYDLDTSGVQRKGPVASDVLTVKPNNNPPFAPLLFTAVRNADNTTTADVDAADSRRPGRRLDRLLPDLPRRHDDRRPLLALGQLQPRGHVRRRRDGRPGPLLLRHARSTATTPNRP